MYSTDLYRSIVNDRQDHPERVNATLERVGEALEVVVADRAEHILTLCSKGVSDRRGELTDEQGRRISTILGEQCSADEVDRITRMLMDSPIATQEAIDLHEKFKIPVSHLEKDIVPVRGDGPWIIDSRGRAYLDMDSNYSATNLGMANPEIARGLYNQAVKLISMKEDRVHIPRTQFLKNIYDMMPEGLTHFYWQNSGGEAVDKALKVAKAHTGVKGVVSMRGGFHGRTHGAVSVTYNEKYRKPFFLDDEDWVHFVDFGDAEAVNKLFEEGKAKSVIFEYVQGEEGACLPADPKFIKELRKVCDKHEAVMIADEIQTGFGRTAKKEGQWFACMTYGVIPDIMTIGKSFGGGYPVTAVVTRPDISASMKPGYDGSTFGGNPMAMVAAMIATRQMRELNVTGNVVKRSKQIFDGLEDLKKKHSIVGEIRGLGLMVAFELQSAEQVSAFQGAMAQHGVKTSLATGHWVRFLPPLVITESDTKHLLQAIDGSLASLS